MTRRLAVPALLLLPLATALAGCGGSEGTSLPPVAAARTYGLAGFSPPGRFAPNVPVRVSFHIRQPDGRPLTAFKRGPGPHTGIHLIIVRRDLSTIVHRHPPVAADGTISQVVTLPPGPYRVVVDAYPAHGSQPNFQLFRTLTVRGRYTPKPIGPSRTTVVSDGYRFTIQDLPRLHAVQAATLQVTVRDPRGRPARFTAWYGALAHAIFFRDGSLDYFHTHVCARGAAGCTSILGATHVTGTSSAAGNLSVGVLVPLSGTWRLFLQCRVNGQVVTAPFTLHVAA